MASGLEPVGIGGGEREGEMVVKKLLVPLDDDCVRIRDFGRRRPCFPQRGCLYRDDFCIFPVPASHNFANPLFLTCICIPFHLSLSLN